MKGSAIQPEIGARAGQAVVRSPRQEELAARIAALAAEALGVHAAPLDVERPLTALGLDSLAAVELAAGLEAQLGSAPPLALVLAGASCRELAHWLESALDGAARTEPPAAGGGAGSALQAAAAPAAARQPDEFPLSPGQQALWFLERLAPTAGAYNVVVAAEARGLNPDLLSSSLTALAARHAALRTVFPLRGDQPVQRVLAEPAIDFAVIAAAGSAAGSDGAAGSEGAAGSDGADGAAWAERQVRQQLADEAWRPFDLERGPLVRVRLLAPPAGSRRRGPLLLVAIHHLVSDFWSLRILARDLSALLEAGRAAARPAGAGAMPPPIVAPPAATFVECAHRQAVELAGARGERDWEFWRQTLAGERGAVPDLALPTDRPRPAEQGWRALVRSTVLPAAATAALRRLAAAEGATLFAALATVWQLQLGRYAGQDDFAVGTPTAGRRTPECAGVVGYFVNPVALRADLRGAPPVGELLGRVRDAVVAALDHADFPFAWLAERLRPVRDAVRPPLFQAMLALEPRRPGDPAGMAAFAQGDEGACLDLGGGVQLTAVALPERRAQVELTLSVAELAGGGLALALEANADLFDAPAIGRMLGAFTTLAAAAAAEPARRAWELPMLTAAEQAQLLRDWAVPAPAADPAAPWRPLHQLVARQASRAPAATALVIGDACWTYQCLAARAADLAGLLGRLPGMGPHREQTVALLVDRSVDLVAGALGILGAGATLLALDPEHALPRLAWTLADAGAAAVVSQRRYAAQLADLEAPRIWLDELPAGAGGGFEERPEDAATGKPDRMVAAYGGHVGGLDGRRFAAANDGHSTVADQGGPVASDDSRWASWDADRAAYLVYTSGSTGLPKGVAVGQGAAAAEFAVAARTLALAPGERMLQLPSTGFDAALEQIFATLIAGATLVMRGREPWGPRELAAQLATREVTVADLPAAFLAHWVADAQRLPAPAPALRLVMVSGEELRAQTVRRYAASPLGRVPLWNCYGPTEAVVSATLHEVRPEDGQDLPVPIGRALPGRVARVLDRHGQAQPLGVPGELCLGGLLARGYHARPDLTAASFVPDPWGSPGTRLYRTGDLVRRRAPGGELEFLGRLDQQVKVRGFRVEPGEIAALLAEHPAVAAAAVLALPASMPPTAMPSGATPPASAGASDVPAVSGDLRAPRAPGVPSTAGAPSAADAPSAAGAPSTAAGVPSAVAAPSTAAGALGAAGASPAGQELRLVAFVAPALPADLAELAARRLPGYMVPAVWLALPALPTNASGKVDRAALAGLAAQARPLRPLPAAAAHGARAPAAADASLAAIEELLAGAWATLLGRDAVGRDEDFFTLGGHSLLATRVVAQVSQLFGVDLPLSTVFAAPTVSQLAARIATAAAGVPDGSAAGTAPALAAARHDPARLPLSFAQRRLWFLEQLSPGTALYNIPGAVRLTGALDPAALAAALAAIAGRHQVLRTAIVAESGEPVERLVAWPAAALPLVDLAALPRAVRQGEAGRLQDDEARRPFDLARGPMLRTRLLRLEGGEHVLLATFHHLAADGWSLGVFLDELAALYPRLAARGAAGELLDDSLAKRVPLRAEEPPAREEGSLARVEGPLAREEGSLARVEEPSGRTADLLPPLPVQYVDFAVWQAAWLAGGAQQSQLAYWRQRLAGAPATELPTDRQRPAVRSSRGATRSAPVPAATAAAVAALARREGVTVFMALLGLFQTLAGRLSGEPRVAVGTPVANRRRAQIEPLIGLFVNTLVLDVELADDPPAGELLARVRQACLGAYAHQDLPFERLVEALQPRRDLARHPLFQLMFALNEPLPALTVPAAAPSGALAARAGAGAQGDGASGSTGAGAEGDGTTGNPGASAEGDCTSGNPGAGAGGWLRIAPLAGAPATAKFDLLLALTPDERGGWLAQAEYATDLWQAASIDRLLGQFANLLAGAALVPRDTRLSALPLLSAAERQQLLVEWNDTVAPAAGAAEAPVSIARSAIAAGAAETIAGAGGACLHDLVLAQAMRTPDAPAVAGDGGQLTYAELAAAARRLAIHLRQLGAGPEVCAGVCLGRTPAMVAAFLGVLQSGAAYVPLDPALPVERRLAMLARCGATLLVTDGEHAAPLVAAGGFAGRVVLLGGYGDRDEGADGDDRRAATTACSAHAERLGTLGRRGDESLGEDDHGATAAGRGPTGRVVMLDRRGDESADGGERGIPAAAGSGRAAGAPGPVPSGERSVQPERSAQDERSLAYVIFTSGSTGEPKAVGIEHRSAVALVRWALGVFDRGQLAGVLAATSVGFDLSVFEIFVPLGCGGQVILAPSIAHLGQVRRLDAVTLLNTVPSPMAELVAAPLPPAARTVNLAGEALAAELVARIAAHPQVERVLNLYGPSESTTYATWDLVWSRRVAAAGGGGAVRVTIGRPVTGTTFRVFGRHGEPLPVGAPGELALGGLGLARGYLGRPDLTAERFVPDPCGDLPGARLYRTGDRVRLLPDGRLDYLGRLDQQVKVRGVRVEPGEVETVLSRHPEVAQAAVVARPAAATAAGGAAATAPAAGEAAIATAAAGAAASGAAAALGGAAGLRLVGYVVPAAGAAPASAADLPARLAAWLRERLPAAMVPEAWVVLPELPLSSNGKVDRRALPAPAAPAGALAGAASPDEAPRAGAEQILSAIWQDILGGGPIGRRQDFFALGGHSLLALRAAFRIGQAFAIDVPVTALFQAPTVEALAVWLAERGAAPRAAAAGAAPGATAAWAIASAARPGATAADAPPEATAAWAAAPGPTAAATPPAAAGDAGAGASGLPLSAAQRRMWFLERLHPGQAGYELSLAVRLDGALSLAALAGAVAGVVARHQPLRTVYSEIDGQPRQIVLPLPAAPPLAVADLRSLRAERRAAAPGELEQALAGRPFDLERGPVARFLLAAVGPSEHVLLFACHHIAADGWSLQVLFRDLAALYGAALAGRPSPLSRPAPRYADHVLAEARRLGGGELERQLAWWRARLEGVAVLDLPLDRPRPARFSSRGLARRFTLDAATAAGLGAVARQQGATLFAALLAGYAAYLARHSGQDDVAMGVPVAGRTHAGSEQMVGLFVNTLVARIDLADSPSFAALVGRVRDAMLGAQAHQDLPFETLVENLRPARAPGVSPLFQALFSYLGTAFGDIEMAGLSLRLLPGETATARFDLSCDVHQQGGGLTGNLDLAAALFEPATASRLRDHLTALLAAAAAQPRRRALELPMLSAAERHQVAVEWNQRAGDGVSCDTPLAHILRHAAAAPGRRAVVCGDNRLTYGQLAERSRRLAERLRQLGAGREDRVGLLLERSAGVPVAMLAVWQAGAAWVPFDPALPAARLAALAADAGLRALITDAGCTLAADLGVPRLELAPADLGAAGSGAAASAADSGGAAALPAAASSAAGSSAAAGAAAASAVTGPALQGLAALRGMPGAPGAPGTPAWAAPPPAARDLAYLIYTSGTTGVPKAVAIEHGNLLQTLLAWRTDYPMGAGDRALVLAPLWFDTSVIELFEPLIAGAEVEMVPSLDILDMPRLVQALGRATLAFQVPSLLRRVAAWRLDPEGGAAAPPPAGPRWLFPAGERVSGDLVRELRQAFPATEVLGSYGPTETSVTCATWRPPRPLLEADERGLLGRPLAGARLTIRDRWENLAPIGVAGELRIGGGGVGRGYLNRPELTADRFRPAPGGARSYRSGDLTRLLSDGRIEFLGRTDHQIKLRGFRIEPGEIEAALRAEAGVLDALVMVAAAAAPGAEPRLTAYVLPEAPEAAAPPARQELAERLRRRLGERLPDYMVPGAWVVLAAFPQSASGKVDRRALPPPEPDAGQPEDAAAAAPRTPEEELLAALWAEVLGLERVGPQSDFFALGGHSLLLTQLASRVRRAFGVEVPLADLFAARTLAEQAARLGELLRRQTAADRPAAAPAQPALAATRPMLPIPPLTALPAAARRQPLPLSFAQERLWLLERLEPGPLYNMPVAARLRGALRQPALAAALGAIVRRHEVLRTRLVAERGRPAQIVLPYRPEQAGRLPLVDLSALPAGAAADAARALTDAAARRPFDLTSGRLVRSLLLRLGAADHWLVVVLHHIAADGWSMGVLLDELAALYTAGAGAGPGLPELPVQYADFAVWQRGWLSGERLAHELAHWRQRLAGAPQTLELPADRPRQADGAAHGGQHAFTLPAGARGQLARLARRRGWTPFMPLLAAFAAVLARWGGRRDPGEVVIGSPIANRHVLELERLIGFFANTLALRLDLTGDPALGELADRARAVCLDAYAHQDLPFEKLVEELAPVRQAGTTPLFNVMLVLQNVPLRLAVPGVAVELLDAGSGTAKFDLAVFLMESGGELAGSVEFRRDLFDAATVARLVGHFNTLVAGAVAAPETRLAELPLLTPGEREQLARMAAAPPQALAAGRAAAAAGRTILHRRVARQAALAPDALAAVFEGQHLSYAELAARSRRLAQALRRLGVGPDVVVGLHVERSLDALVALLGILEAGGAFLALDPDSPAERLRLMLDDARAPVIVTQARLAGELPAGGARIVLVDRPAPAAQDAAALDADLLPGHLMYVCYTSGSTGRPKGVAMPHAALAAMIDWQLRTSHAGQRTLNFTSLSFDVSIQELFATWSAGGTVVGIGEETRRDPAALAGVLAGEQVTRLFLPFVALQQLAVAALAAPPAGFPAALAEVLSAGEQLYVTPQVAALAARLPGLMLYNHYGPTEAHAVTWLALAGDPAAWPERPSIGGPLDHARVLLLDRHLQRVPVGVPGEVWAAGPGLARCYLGRRRLTADRFMPDPFADVAGWQPGSRMYRLGDVARQLPDGTLEFLGRTDFQVKVRGHRIEVAEIETALARHPAVLQAAVVAHGEDAASRRLAACVVCAPHAAPPAAADLRTFLARTLPAPMVPSGWLRAARLPLTATGKLDRRVLERWAGGAFTADDDACQPVPLDGAALPATAGGGQGAADAALRHPAEELMAGIWREVLGAVEIAPDDDFFALGGHSLLATQVASRIREVFGVELPLRRLFEEPTLAGMSTAAIAAITAITAPAASGAESADGAAAGAHGAAGEAAAAAPPPLVAVPHDRPLPLSFAQERLWFLDRLQPGSSVYNLPLVLRAGGALDPARLAAALGLVVRRHQVLRTRYAEQGGRPVQIVNIAAPVPVPVVDLAALSTARRDGEAQALLAAAADRPFDLAQGPVLRVLAVTLGGGQGPLLLVNLHHIAADGWSLGVLVREMQAAWRPAAPEPPPLAVQYADFAVWQRRFLSGATLARQLGWWRERLRGARTVLELPVDRPRPPVASLRGAEHVFALDAELVARLAAAAAQGGATLFMALAGGMCALLSRLAGESDLILGTPIANRNRIEIEPLIGCFVNMLALRVQVDGGGTWGDLLRAVRDTSLGAYAHQDVPFEMLVDELAPERDLSRPPLVQVAMALQNAPQPAADLDGVRLTSQEPGSRTAKLELTWSFAAGDRGRLDATLQYAADLFDAASAVRMADRLGVLFEQLLQDPQARLAGLALLSPAERHQLVNEWNDTAVEPLPGWDDPAAAPAVHHRIARHAARTPQALAVCAGEQRLTFAELDTLAGRLAWRLHRAGAGQQAPVALWLDRSPALVIAELAALKAGAAYLPLDPGWPAARVQAILESAGARLLVTSAGSPAVATAGVRRFDVETEVAADAQANGGATGHLPSGVSGVSGISGVPAVSRVSEVPTVSGAAGAAGSAEAGAVLPGSLAYVIYTSGSTGEPKGVEISHGALAGMVRWNERTYGWGPGERGTLLASPSFDASVFETWPVLAAGASLHIPETAVRLVPERLLAWLADEGVTVSFMPTALAEQVVAAAEAACPQGMRLRTVLAGGDRLRHPPRRPLPFDLINLYGPAESTVVATVGSCPAVASGGGEPAIGRPVWGTRIYLVDAAGQLVPAGTPGEMYLAGDSLARGYLGRPDLTAERFLPDAWSGQAGSRVYRTGDTARHEAAGTLAFLGRVDAQVKVRGCRIEPAEIEAALRRQAGVRHAAVVPRRGAADEVQLVGYVVLESAAPAAQEPAAAGSAAAAAQGAAVSPAALRERLAAELPEYMVPAVLIELPALPVTTNGKLDRAALPEPPDRQAAEAKFTAPRNDRERLIAEAWRQVLGRERVGVDESFFAVGGSSLAMVELQSRLRAALGREVPLIELFRHPTIEGLAASLDAGEQQATDAAAGAAEQARARVAARRQAVRRQAQRKSSSGRQP